MRRLKDVLQVAEMRFSEACAMRKTEQDIMVRCRQDAADYRRRVIQADEQVMKAEASERTANEERADMKRQVQLAERDTRTVTFQNLALQRRIASLPEIVARTVHDSIRTSLESRVSAQAERIAALEEELAARDLEREGEEGGISLVHVVGMFQNLRSTRRPAG